MLSLFDDFTARLRKHASYRRTVRALRALPIDTALDLDIYAGDAERIARRAVYGA